MSISPADRIDRHVPGTVGIAFNGQLLESWGCYLPGNGYRAYNPVLKRFHSPDRWSPFERGGLNAYAYCSGDPVSRVDPSGRWEEAVTPLLAILLNVALFRVAVLGIRSSAPAMQSGPSLYATYVSATGALVGTYGAVEQLLGNPEGRYISWIGTAISATAAWWRSGISRKADREERFNENLMRKRQKILGPAAEIQYVPPSSQPTSPLPIRPVPASPVPSSAGSARLSPRSVSRSNTGSPATSTASHPVELRPPSGLSMASRPSTSSQQSVFGDLPTFANTIRKGRRKSARQYMVDLS